MANQKQAGSQPQERSEPAKKTGTEWPHNPPLPSREEDPTGEGDALRSKAHPGDDTVFAANADDEKKPNSAPKKKEDNQQKKPN
ncbi:hypothetical protein [Sandaracinus amylolyticus]|uniref:Uncharacterized protein n=1 Tax=Sandaracinus amylolyticus TaxID=927083 RepID=A0A0F6SHJ7_9BACT|nr:hypothetical protein [Sandaracinus amylolyticus]AKF10564.1 hypothetical protein DB32_007713 [Sandaracinus amylolyticus]